MVVTHLPEKVFPNQQLWTHCSLVVKHNHPLVFGAMVELISATQPPLPPYPMEAINFVHTL